MTILTKSTLKGLLCLGLLALSASAEAQGKRDASPAAVPRLAPSAGTNGISAAGTNTIPSAAKVSTNSIVGGVISNTSTNGNGNGNSNTNGNAGGNGKGNAFGKDKPSIAQRPNLISRSPNSDPNALPDQKGNPDKPNRPGNPAPSADVQTLINNFQAAREAYLQQQNALSLQYQSASEAQRQAIRDQMKDLFDSLKEQQKALQQEMKDRAKELKNELNPNLGRVIDGATSEGRGK